MPRIAQIVVAGYHQHIPGCSIFEKAGDVIKATALTGNARTKRAEEAQKQ